jgi:hypothetical protein
MPIGRDCSIAAQLPGSWNVLKEGKGSVKKGGQRAALKKVVERFGG